MLLCCKVKGFFLTELTGSRLIWILEELYTGEKSDIQVHSIYWYIIPAGFSISKSLKPKSVVLNEFILKTSCPVPGING